MPSRPGRPSRRCESRGAAPPPPPPDAAGLARASSDVDELLAAGLAAYAAAHGLEAIVPDDPDAATAMSRAALGLAEVAEATEHWSIARGALDRAAARGVETDRAREARARVDAARARRLAERRREVGEILDEARSGALAARPGGRRAALFRLVALQDRQTVRLLVEELDEIVEELREAARVVYGRAQPTPEEAARGEPFLPHLEEMIEARVAGEPGSAMPAPLQAIYFTAHRRIIRRARDAVGPGVPVDPFALAQERRIGEGGVAVAMLCCQALGRIGIEEGAVDALGRYLWAEEGETRAVHAGIALCLLGGARAQRLAVAARRRFDVRTGPYWNQVGRHAWRFEGDLPLISEDGQGYYERAIVRRAGGDIEGALEDLGRAIELLPDDDRPRGDRGNLLSDLGRFEEAEADLSVAIERQPRLAIAWVNRGVVRRRRGDVRGALDDFERAIELDDEIAVAWNGVGNGLTDLDRFADALQAYARAVDLDPDYAEAWCNRGNTYLALGRRDLARADYDRAIAIDPGLVSTWTNRSFLRYQEDDLEGAISDASRAIELAPQFADAWNNRAIARGQRGDLEGAIADASRAIEIEPDDPASWGNRGTAKMFAGDSEGALVDLTRCLELRPNDLSMRAKKVDALVHLGRRDEAVLEIQEMIRRAPTGSSWVGEARARMARLRAGD